MKTHYKNSVLTKRKIALAYLDLLIARGDDFSVTDLVQQSQINRGTFYLHFKCKQDVWLMITQGMTDKFKPIEEQFRTFDIDRSPEVVLNKFNMILKGDLEFYTKVIQAGEKINLIEKIKQVILNSINNNFKVMKYIFTMSRFTMVCQYIVGGIVNIYKEWFNKNIDCTLDEMANYLSLLIRKGLKGCINYES